MKLYKNSKLLNGRDNTLYVDSQGILGPVGDTYTYNELVDMYNDLKHDDPVVAEYNNMQDWLADTIAEMDEEII